MQTYWTTVKIKPRLPGDYDVALRGDVGQPIKKTATLRWNGKDWLLQGGGAVWINGSTDMWRTKR